MFKFFMLLFFILGSTYLLADDCLNNGTSPNSALKDSNFEGLMLLTDNLKNKMGGPEKGFYLHIESTCKFPLYIAVALASWGKRDDLLSAAYYEPLYVHGWWTIEANGYLKQFFERKITEHFSIHAHTSTGLVWGKETYQYTINGAEGPKVYPFLEYDSAKKCKPDANGVVTCTVQYTCK